MSSGISSVVPGLAIVHYVPPPLPLWRRALSIVLRSNIGRGLLLILLYRIYLLIRRQRRKKDLRGKLFLITGGGNGIGRSLALVLARRGARLALWDIDAAGLDETSSLLRKDVPAVVCHTARVDLGSRQQIESASLALKARSGEIGHLWGLVNNAGIICGEPFLSTPPERIEASMRINVLAHAWTMQSFLPGMISRAEGGHFVSVASAAGLFGAPRMSAYCASKFAAVGMHESIRLELKKDGQGNIGSTLVCPAHVDTRLFKGYKPGLLQKTLSPNQLAESIAQAIENGDELLLTPWPVRMAYILRGCMPTAWEDEIKRFTGLWCSMDEWKGQNGS